MGGAFWKNWPDYLGLGNNERSGMYVEKYGRLQRTKRSWVVDDDSRWLPSLMVVAVELPGKQQLPSKMIIQELSRRNLKRREATSGTPREGE